MNDLAANLLKKYLQGTLAQVYLAKYPVHTNPFTWAQHFIKTITPLADHPDILWIERSLENEYKVESIGILALYKFLNYRAFELKKKFIFINDAHLMSLTVSNKLLKVFEELPQNFCLFLFAPLEQSLLPTVESRAINILLPQDLSIQANEAAPIHYASVQELVTKLKKSEDEYLDEKYFIEKSLIKTLQSSNFGECSEVLENLKLYQLSDAFNNSKLSRLSLFFR